MTAFNHSFGILLLFAVALQWPAERLMGQSIWIDEAYEDWEVYTPIHQDKAGDGAPNGLDFTQLKIANSEKHLFFYLEVGREILLQDNNALHLYIDLDNNPLTGAEEHGIGAEIVFHFGGRTGKFYSPFGVVNLSQNALQLVTAPTVSSQVFEFSIARELLIAGQSVSLEGTISVVFSDERTQGDRIPDAMGGIAYTFAPDASHTLPPYTLSKSPEDEFRLMAYNVRRDDLFNPSLRENYRRIFHALQPDLLAFSEIYDHSALETAQQVEILYPAGGEQTWYFAGVNPDIRLISRYPILDTERLDGNGAFHLRKGNQDMVVIVTHLPCCDNNNARQREIDRIMAFVRDVRWSQSNFQIPPHTPILITGDKNFVGPRQQLHTLLYGDIVNTQTFGLGLLPDWNDQPLQDAKPYTTGTPFTYTWRSPPSSYNPGRLDFIAFTSSVLQLNNTFALSTEQLPLDSLTHWGLQAQDTERASDHLPIVADFTWKPSTLSQSSIEKEADHFWKIYPNPSQNWFRIEVNPQAIQEDWQLLIEDTQGRVLQKTPLPGGSTHRDVFFALPKGVYLVRVLGSSAWLPPKILLVQP
jgi:endonuclease/exonuclease/phosphatase family metal-dependent hydrolase